MFLSSTSFDVFWKALINNHIIPFYFHTFTVLSNLSNQCNQRFLFIYNSVGVLRQFFQCSSHLGFLYTILVFWRLHGDTKLPEYALFGLFCKCKNITIFYWLSGLCICMYTFLYKRKLALFKGKCFPKSLTATPIRFNSLLLTQ